MKIKIIFCSIVVTIVAIASMNIMFFSNSDLDFLLKIENLEALAHDEGQGSSDKSNTILRSKMCEDNTNMEKVCEPNDDSDCSHSDEDNCQLYGSTPGNGGTGSPNSTCSTQGHNFMGGTCVRCGFGTSTEPAPCRHQWQINDRPYGKFCIKCGVDYAKGY